MSDATDNYTLEALPKGIRKRGDSYACSVTYRGERKTATEPTLEAAIIRKARLQAELRGHPLPCHPAVQAMSNKPWTIEKAITVTHQTAWKGTSWETNAVHHAKAFAKFFGARCPLDEVTTECLDQWIIHLEDHGKSNGTINRYSKLKPPSHAAICGGSPVDTPQSGL
jgi:hypothetical protein